MMRAVLLLVALLLTTGIAATDSELERAYAKEFAFLKAQKEMLQQRLEAVKKEDKKKIERAKKEIERLQATVLLKTERSDQLTDTLFKAQQNAQNVTDDVSMIESVVLQAKSSLKPYKKEIEVNKEDYPKTLQEIFQKSTDLYNELSQVKAYKGSFYMSDGTEKQGTLIHVGNIAMYGISGDVAGALVPAGGGKFKLWNAPEAAKSANALANNQAIETLDIFLVENSSKEIDDKKEKTALDVINSGGIIGWVIVGLGAFGMLLVIARFFFLSAASGNTDKIAKETLVELQRNSLEGALEFLDTKKGPIARLLKATLRNIDRDREHIEDIIAENIIHESGRLDRFGAAIIVIAAVSPLLGLLGTVTGMIATFDIITEFGTGDPKLLSSGISIALVTTELGLIVAIPMILLGNLLSGWAEKIKDAMEQSALHLLNEYAKLQK